MCSQRSLIIACASVYFEQSSCHMVCICCIQSERLWSADANVQAVMNLQWPHLTREKFFSEAAMIFSVSFIWHTFSSFSVRSILPFLRKCHTLKGYLCILLIIRHYFFQRDTHFATSSLLSNGSPFGNAVSSQENFFIFMKSSTDKEGKTFWHICLPCECIHSS